MSRIGPTRGRSISSRSRSDVEPERLAAVEVLVLERGQHAVVEAEAAAQPHAHPVVRGGAVERAGDRRPPVDDDRVAGGVADVAAADVEDLGAGASRRRGSRSVRPKNGGASGSASRAASRSARTRPSAWPQLVDAVVGDAVGGRAHGDQAVAGEFEVGAFGEQNRIVGHDRSTLRRVANGIFAYG